jgi:hypothetical protein
MWTTNSIWQAQAHRPKGNRNFSWVFAASPVKTAKQRMKLDESQRWTILSAHVPKRTLNAAVDPQETFEQPQTGRSDLVDLTYSEPLTGTAVPRTRAVGRRTIRQSL